MRVKIFTYIFNFVMSKRSFQVVIYVHILVRNTDNSDAILQRQIGDQMMSVMVNPYRRI